MEVSQIIAGIDAEILKLTEARNILHGLTKKMPAPKSSRGRPKGSKNAASTAPAATVAPVARKRKLSPEGRKRIADAMKRRWAERKKAAAK